MRIAQNWQEYRLLDASDGMRLERWGEVTLVRPDPQVIWQTGQQDPRWRAADATYHRSEKGGGRWETPKPLPDKWRITYRPEQLGGSGGEMRLTVSPTGFKHTGIFPEQAVNWERYIGLIRAAKRPVRVLNLFGYTGGATLACALAGAEVTHLDASKGMVAWARENAAQSGLEAHPIRWLVDDCARFVAREARRGKVYDALILDPPSYGRGPSGEVWKLEDSLWPLLSACAEIISEDPLFFSLSSYTAGLAPGVGGYMLRALLGPRFGGAVESGEIGLPVESTGGVLPCGSTAIWAGSP